MNAEMIANIIVNMALDMDYADFMEFYEESIREIAEELKTVSKPLFDTLETIAVQNVDLYDWAKNNDNAQKEV